MRRFVRDNILQIVSTLYDAHKEIKKFVDKRNYATVEIILDSCRETAVQVGNVIEQSEGEGFITVKYLEEYCEALYEVSQSIDRGCNGNKVRKILSSKLTKVKNSVNTDIKIKLEIVFLPYKLAMFDSLWSVYIAAAADPLCDAYLIPIPYYDRNPDGSFGQLHYEGNEYPADLPVVSCESYDIAARKPDIIYIHNPYDQYNFVTSVDKRYYSSELKKYTDMLVYIPYYISGFFNKSTVEQGETIPCSYYTDKIVLQSEYQKRMYEAGGIPNDKLLLLGSPKVDYVINNYNSIKAPDEWQETIKGKKTFLLNTSIKQLLKTPNWPQEMNKIIDLFDNNTSIALIWRPHPLLGTSVASMRQKMEHDYNSVCERIKNLDNAIIDTFASPYKAIKASDAMISDYSSLVMMYSLTGKPTLVTVGSSEFRQKKAVCFDYFSNYFVEDGVTIQDFIDMVVKGTDEQYAERKQTVFKGLINADGSCGEKVHQKIIEELMML